jgi:hypothetical protein
MADPPISAEDLEKLKAHLSRFPKQTCPSCRNTTWAVGGIITGLTVRSADMRTVMGGPNVPLVLLICRRCFYVRHFAWVPISNGENGLE